MFLQICNTPSTENEELYLLQIFSFLLLRALKPEGVLEFLKTLSWCTKDNAELLAFVLDIILSFEVITPISTHCETLLIVFQDFTPTHNSDDTSAIFPSFLLSLEIQESAVHCKQLKTGSTILLELVAHEFYYSECLKHTCRKKPYTSGLRNTPKSTLTKKPLSSRRASKAPRSLVIWILKSKSFVDN